MPDKYIAPSVTSALHTKRISNYAGNNSEVYIRPDLRAISQWLHPQATVLDLGCGDGQLLTLLIKEHRVTGYGIEINDAKVLSCVQNGIHVLQQNLEEGLALFEDQSFDFVILSQTLQTVHHTEHLLQEIMRVGKECIVSFPNFGHWAHRLAVLRGRMPVSSFLPYQWYETPNVRVLTIADFEALAQTTGFTLLDRLVLHRNQVIRYWPNLFGSLAVYRIRRAI